MQSFTRSRGPEQRPVRHSAQHMIGNFSPAHGNSNSCGMSSQGRPVFPRIQLLPIKKCASKKACELMCHTWDVVKRTKREKKSQPEILGEIVRVWSLFAHVCVDFALTLGYARISRKRPPLHQGVRRMCARLRHSATMLNRTKLDGNEITMNDYCHKLRKKILLLCDYLAAGIYWFGQLRMLSFSIIQNIYAFWAFHFIKWQNEERDFFMQHIHLYGYWTMPRSRYILFSFLRMIRPILAVSSPPVHKFRLSNRRRMRDSPGSHHFCALFARCWCWSVAYVLPSRAFVFIVYSHILVKRYFYGDHQLIYGLCVINCHQSAKKNIAFAQNCPRRATLRAHSA